MFSYLDANFHSDTHKVVDKHESGNVEESGNVDEAFCETVIGIDNDRSKIWNFIDVEAVYSDNGGCIKSRRVLVENVLQHFDDVIPLHSPGTATLLVFENHVANHLRLVVADKSDDMSECIREVGKEIVIEIKAAKCDMHFFNQHIDKDIAK